MIAARKFISDLLFIKYLVLRWEINIRKGGKRDRIEGKKTKKNSNCSRSRGLRGCRAGWGVPRPFASPSPPGKHLHMVGTVALGTCGCS